MPFLEKLIKAITYLALPFQYPGRGFALAGRVFTNRALVHELARLTPQRDYFRKLGLRTILDVGSYTGSFAYAMRTILPDAQIYSFEPLPDNYTDLVKNLAPLGRFEAFNTALGDAQGTLDFHRSDFSPSSSALPMGDLHRRAFPHSARTSLVTVPVARLDDYLDRLTLTPPVMLKIDVQGFEAAVLKGAPRTLAQVDLIEVEVSFQPLYEGQALFADIFKLLTQAGFKYGGELDTMISPLDGAILQADALFTRVQ